VKTIVGILKLTRPLNAMLAGVAVWLGLHLGGTEADWSLIIFGALSAILVTAFANIDNDIGDVAIDRINRPARPLPAGKVTLRAAILASLICLAAGLVAAGICGQAGLAVAGGVAIFLLLYNRWGKRRFLIGNLMIAVAGGMPVLYAGIILAPAPGRWKYIWVAYLLGAAFHLVREILKDVQDVEGDAQAGAKTLPVVIGTPHVARTAGVLLVLFSFSVLIPAILGWMYDIYLYGSIVLVILPAVSGGYRLWQNPTPREAGIWSEATRGMMAAGLILLWLSVS